MAKLVIRDPETGERLCSLVIPPGATQEQIVEAGQTVLNEFRRRLGGQAPQPEAPRADRDVLCVMCREPIPESQLAAHVEVEQHRLIQIELAQEAQRGRR